MKTFYMMVGLPGSGKSTWAVQKSGDSYGTYETVLSTDNIIELLGEEHGFTYNEMFSDITYAFAEKMMHQLARMCFARGDSIIWDQTNLTEKSRAKKLDMVPEGYRKVCVVVRKPEDLQERLDKRGKEEGKVIPTHVMKAMEERYEEPSVDEGFDEVIYVG